MFFLWAAISFLLTNGSKARIFWIPTFKFISINIIIDFIIKINIVPIWKTCFFYCIIYINFIIIWEILSRYNIIIVNVVNIFVIFRNIIICICWLNFFYIISNISILIIYKIWFWCNICYIFLSKSCISNSCFNSCLLIFIKRSGFFFFFFLCIIFSFFLFLYYRISCRNFFTITSFIISLSITK